MKEESRNVRKTGKEGRKEGRKEGYGEEGRMTDSKGEAREREKYNTLKD